MQIRVCGSVPQLGEWDPARGLELQTSFEFFPCWITKEPVSLPVGQRIEYSYVIISTKNPSQVRWSVSSVLTAEAVRRVEQHGSNNYTEDEDHVYIENYPVNNVLELFPTGVEMTVEDDGMTIQILVYFVRGKDGVGNCY